MRGIFIALAALALTIQARRLAADQPPKGESSLAAGPAAGLAAGLAALGLQPGGVDTVGRLYATAPGCAEKLVLTQVDFDGFGRDTARALMDGPADPRFVYLGFAGDHASPAPIVGRWAVASALHVIGLRRDAPPRDVVLVMLPRACPALTTLRWSALSPWS